MNELSHDLYIQLCEVKKKEYDKRFSKNQYEAAFEELTSQYQEFYQKLQEEYGKADEKEAFILDVATGFVNLIKEELSKEVKRRKSQEALFQINFKLVTFLFPGCSEKAGEAGRFLNLEIAKLWKKEFPKTPVTPAEYAQIRDGFHHNYCYITSAICESLGKDDSCYELKCLRGFRDNYLLGREDGAMLVRSYYDLAPTIVKHIDKRENRLEIYEKILHQYLQPCIQYIEKNENEKCMEFYSKMVYDLKEEYF